MPDKKYRTTEERQELKALVSKGRAAAYKQTHARILLLSDEAQKDGGMTDEEMPGPSRPPAPQWKGCAAVVWRKGSSGLGAQGATTPPAKETGWRGGSPLDCPGLRGTAGRPGPLDTANRSGWSSAS